LNIDSKGEKMEPTIVKKEAFTVVGMKYRGKNEHREIPQLWSVFIERIPMVKHIADPHVCYGVCDNEDESTGVFDYIAGLPVTDVSEIPEGMIHWEIPEQTYAMFTCTLSGIHEAFAYAYKTWLPQSGYQRADGPDLELYDEEFEPESGRDKMYIYIPIA
jgi:AraC family transcriptional regulator